MNNIFVENEKMKILKDESTEISQEKKKKKSHSFDWLEFFFFFIFILFEKHPFEPRAQMIQKLLEELQTRGNKNSIRIDPSFLLGWGMITKTFIDTRSGGIKKKNKKEKKKWSNKNKIIKVEECCEKEKSIAPRGKKFFSKYNIYPYICIYIWQCVKKTRDSRISRPQA